MKNTMKMVIGALAGAAGGYVIGSVVNKTDAAGKDPDAAYKAKLAGAGGAALLGVGALAMKKPVAGAALLGLGLGAGGEGYTAHEAYKTSTAPPSASLSPGGGQPPIILQAPVIGGIPVQMGPIGTSPPPGAIPVDSVKLLPPATQSSGAVRLQSGASVRLQSGAAVRLGMQQSSAAVRLGM